jgi:hypothetical protein
LLLPHLQHVVVRLRQVQAVVFGKSLAHKISVKFLLSLNGLQGRRKPNAKNMFYAEVKPVLAKLFAKVSIFF